MQQPLFYLIRLYLLLLVILLMSVIPAQADGGDVGDLLNISTSGLSSSSIRLEVNDHMVATEGGTRMLNGRAMVPLKIITDTLGITATFSDSGIIKIDDVLGTMYLKVGDTQAKVNDKPITLDAAPVIESGQTLVPLRFIAEALNADVKWVSTQNLIKIHRNTLENVTYERYADRVRIIFDLTIPEQYKVFKLHNPERLVVDFTGATYPKKKTEQLINTSIVSNLRVSQFQLQPSITRAVLDLTNPDVTYTIRALTAQRRVVLEVIGKPTPAEPGKTDKGDKNDKTEKTDKNEKTDKTDNNVKQPASNDPVLTATPAEQVLKNKLIVIDPGHGGKNPGAIGTTGTWESNINYDIASRLNELLQHGGAYTIMTRKSEEDPGLWDRPAIANNSHADLFVSVHSDSHPDKATRGTTIYAHNNATQENWSLAWFIHNAIVRNTGLVSKGLRAANFVVLRESQVPAVLVEAAYLSNKEDEAQLKDPNFRQLVAQGIYNGIVEYYNRIK